MATGGGSGPPEFPGSSVGYERGFSLGYQKGVRLAASLFREVSTIEFEQLNLSCQIFSSLSSANYSILGWILRRAV